MTIQMSRYWHGREVERITCAGEREAAEWLREHPEWCLNPAMLVHDDGTPYRLEEANAVRRACGTREQ